MQFASPISIFQFFSSIISWFSIVVWTTSRFCFHSYAVNYGLILRFLELRWLSSSSSCRIIRPRRLFDSSSASRNRRFSHEWASSASRTRHRPDRGEDMRLHWADRNHASLCRMTKRPSPLIEPPRTVKCETGVSEWCFTSILRIFANRSFISLLFHSQNRRQIHAPFRNGFENKDKTV
jgi:hypothetical protein